MTKLAAELMIAEYGDAYGVPYAIDRCGLIAGPWQMGKTDQGVVALWMAAHYFKRPLSYIGFGGTGKQVRDILHVDDLCDLLLCQLEDPGRWNGRVFNAGGGLGASLSLREMTRALRTDHRQPHRAWLVGGNAPRRRSHLRYGPRAAHRLFRLAPAARCPRDAHRTVRVDARRRGPAAPDPGAGGRGPVGAGGRGPGAGVVTAAAPPPGCAASLARSSSKDYRLGDAAGGAGRTFPWPPAPGPWPPREAH